MKPENRVKLVTEGDVDRLGNVALVDPERLAELQTLKWYLERRSIGNYVQRSDRIDGWRKTRRLHNFVFGPVPDGFEIDHRNGNTMDCRRENLRLATTSQNQQNRRKRAGCVSRFKGVTWCAAKRKWQAYMTANGRYVNLGRFDPTPDGEIAAARMYDDFARMHFGEFARTNFRY